MKPTSIKPIVTTLCMATVLSMTACQSFSKTTTTTNPASAVTLPLSDAKLQHYTWQLTSVTDKMGNPKAGILFDKKLPPLQISFHKGGRLVFGNTCNNLSTSYILTNDNVIIGEIMSTRMLCEPERMQFDDLAPSVLQGQFKLTQGADGEPVLTVTGDKLISVFTPYVK
ncbi:hypothetical protein MOMA_07196 [Moraxella macacae 0408225]|uniref:DUF306 domain-containing protein n=1 Tax=Moraxella macacae 0408225 TaxID=1230338 RepID=L2F5J3_9GAMM|nr:META domain-containing protein [Moraxella macacae]ELA08329.1 hypothetical protein MOMA_07196 [Moraxella macacae 0408225]